MNPPSRSMILSVALGAVGGLLLSAAVVDDAYKTPLMRDGVWVLSAIGSGLLVWWVCVVIVPAVHAYAVHRNAGREPGVFEGVPLVPDVVVDTLFWFGVVFDIAIVFVIVVDIDGVWEAVATRNIICAGMVFSITGSVLYLIRHRGRGAVQGDRRGEEQ